MSRSPLAYPLTRSADTEIGGAADLQTDVMRFMAILALCLVAIFALVQSIPLTPQEPVVAQVEPAATAQPQPEPAPPEPPKQATVTPSPRVAAEQPVVLTRPVWQPQPMPTQPAAAAPAVEAAPEPVPEAPPAAETEGFTLRFASDAALMRAVAAHHVGLYAIVPGNTKRMTVSESRVSFWDASTPNAFHEMEATTVPVTVVDALARSGITTGAVNWGVTLPGRMSSRLEDLMREHRGGTLIIGAGGNINWEAS